MFVGLPLYLFGFFALNFPLYDINNYYIVYITQREQFMGNLFKKAKGTLSNYVGSVSGDANAIGSQLKGKLGSMSADDAVPLRFHADPQFETTLQKD